MSEFKIEKNVPIPPSGSGVRKYPFHEMDIGDSFFVEGTDVRTRKRLESSKSYWGTRHGKKFSIRAVDGGMRVWRTK